MRKAVNIGITTGLIFTTILILGTMCRRFLPADTTGANLTFTIIFISAIAIVLLIVMENYSKANLPTWNKLTVISIVASMTTAILFSTASFVYTRFFSSGYLSDLMKRSRQNWIERNYSSDSLAGEGAWTWYKNPWNFAFNNLQVMLVVLFVISVFIAFLYYTRNRNKLSLHEGHNNHELIFWYSWTHLPYLRPSQNSGIYSWYPAFSIWHLVLFTPANSRGCILHWFIFERIDWLWKVGMI